jgi:hypothetical protein
VSDPNHAEQAAAEQAAAGQTAAGQTAAGQTDPATAEPAPPTPGERRLAHPPSDRYRAAEARAAAVEADRPDPAASVVRGVAIAVAIALVGAVAIVVVGGVLSETTGLVVVAGATGLFIAYALQVGAGDHLTTRRRIVIAVVLTVVAIAFGQLGVWQYARSEGGVLPLIDYLGDVFGLLVPLQFAAGIVAAALIAR